MEKTINLTKKQMEVIDRNLRAYINNFGYIAIERESYGKGFYIFTTPERRENADWTQYCHNIDYLDGWLYGCVQTINGIVKPN